MVRGSVKVIEWARFEEVFLVGSDRTPRAMLRAQVGRTVWVHS